MVIAVHTAPLSHCHNKARLQHCLGWVDDVSGSVRSGGNLFQSRCSATPKDQLLLVNR